MNEKLKPYEHLLKEKTFATFTTVLNNCLPHSTPVWFGYDKDSDLFKVAIFEKGQKDVNLQRNPNVSLSIMDPTNPYCYVQIRGSVVNREVDINYEYSDFLTIKYSVD